MILVDRTIEAAQANGGLGITPFNHANLQGNAYDVRLGDTLMVFKKPPLWKQALNFILGRKEVIDCKLPVETISFEIPEKGVVLQPGILYLGVTTERVTLRDFVAELMGKSSLGRLGVSPHYTAGLIDAGFDGFITLEITVVHPTRVYAGEPIGQLVFMTLTDQPINPYNKQAGAKYNGQTECLPVASKFYQNWNEETGKWA